MGISIGTDAWILKNPGEPETLIPKISPETLAEMIGTKNRQAQTAPSKIDGRRVSKHCGPLPLLLSQCLCHTASPFNHATVHRTLSLVCCIKPSG